MTDWTVSFPSPTCPRHKFTSTLEELGKPHLTSDAQETFHHGA